MAQTGAAKSKAALLRGRAIELLLEKQGGIRYSELLKLLETEFPDIPPNTIMGSVWDVDQYYPEQVYKAARGLFRHVKFKSTEAATEPAVNLVGIKPVTPSVKEEQFYKPFAEWLKNELEECTKAISLGGNKFKDKWGTPDVIGIREPKKSDILQFPAEIVSAEVKTDTTELITAFGQACAYRLFSHKTYLVIPNNAQELDLARLDVLARIFGVGLILFNASAPDSPDFEIRVRAAKHDPDMFYVNKNLKVIESELFG